MRPSEDAEFSFVDLSAGDGFRFQGLPDILDEDQTLDPSSLTTFPKSMPSGHDAFNDEQENSAAFALQDSYLEESLSDSSSSKRTSSGASSKGARVGTDPMNDVKMEDRALPGTFSPGQMLETPSHHSLSFGTPPLDMDSTFDEDEFMNQSFDFDRASSSPTDKPKPQVLPDRRPIHKAKSHSKSRSQVSFGAPSREVSPQSTSFVTSNASSPGAHVDFHDPAQMLLQAHGWPHQFNPAANPMAHPMFANAPNPMTTSPAMMLAQYTNFMSMPHNLNPSGPFLSFDEEGMPPRTRVETQIHLKTVFGRLPPGVAKLHLPKHTISKPKLWSKVPHVPSADTLDLHTMLVCTSAMENEESRKRAFKRAREGPNSGFGDPRPEHETEADKPMRGGEVWICSNCVDRERKRSERKKVKKPEEEAIWKAEEWRRVVVFNTHETKEFPKPDPLTGCTVVELPMRIACYCRHQQEKSGFQVIFTIRDHLGRVLAQELTPSIMITDDHKNSAAQNASNAAAAQSAASKASAATSAQSQAKSTQPPAFRPSQSVSDLSQLSNGPAPPSRPLLNSGTSAVSRSLSRPASPGSLTAPHAKKRKSSAGKLPVSMAMTPLETVASSPPGQSHEAQSATTPPYAPGGMFNPQDPFFAGSSPSARNNMFGTAPSTPGIEDQSFFSPTNTVKAKADHAHAQHLYTATRSAHASRAPSPSGFNNALNPAALQSQFSHLFPAGAAAGLNGFNSLGGNVPTPPNQNLPTISKITPSEGSKLGGYEVTILGSGFHRALEVMFGDRKATATWFWADNILLCMVPPSPMPGDVTVTFPQHQSGVQSMINPQKFRYLDDDEDKLLRSAMEVLARKMNGNLGDVKDFAMSILNYRGLPPNQSGINGGASSGQGYGNTANSSSATLDTETQLMKCLEWIDLDDSPYKAQWDYKTSSGHTMLHLACSLGFHRFAAGLVARGANVGVCDNGGYTPLHIAAMNDHPEIVRRLLLAGADPNIRSLRGMVPADVARSDDVIEDLRRVARRTRTRSLGSLRSAPSSTTSLKSLWGQVEQVSLDDRARDDSDVEYSSFDTSDSDDRERDVDDEEDILEMRRPSMHASRANSYSTQHARGEDMGELEAPPSPNAAAAAFRQFQQSMALYMQNLPQLPHMPQMPQMPALPGMGMQADNQAPLYYAQFMRRLSALVPGMLGPRPATPDAETEGPMGIRGWWDRSWAAGDASLPPSYEDLYPHREADSKAKSAEEARAMQPTGTEVKAAVATALETTELDEAASPAQVDDEDVNAAQMDDEMGVLKIGRKNAITKEQQRDILRAHEAKFKRLSSDKNLFMIWIPLLVVVMCALFYGQFPGVFSYAGGLIYNLMGPRAPAGPENMSETLADAVGV